MNNLINKKENIDELNIENLDIIMDLVGELLITKSRMESLDIFKGDKKDILIQLDRVTMELHHNVMKTRMISLDKIFLNIKKSIREFAEKNKEKVDLEFSGVQVEIDRGIIKDFKNILLKVLKNYVLNIRKSGKYNFININAYKSGSEVIIEIKSKNVLFDNFNNKLKEAVENINGDIYLQNENNILKTEIKIPLTFSITEALMVKIKDDVFAIPLDKINETMRISKSEIKSVNNKNVITFRDKTVILVDSYSCLDLKKDKNIIKAKEEIEVVIINNGKSTVGLKVDELLNQQDIVVKTMGEILKNVKHISGATIIGDGEIALILDLRDMNYGGENYGSKK